MTRPKPVVSWGMAILCVLTCVRIGFSAEPVADGPRFLTVGELSNQVIPKKGGAFPEYVLLDEQGEIISRLQAVDGLDLSKYIGDEVGVTVRTIRDGAVPLLLAERVSSFGKAPERQGAPVVNAQLASWLEGKDQASDVRLTAHEEALESVAPIPEVGSFPSGNPSSYPITSYGGESIGPIYSDPYVTPFETTGTHLGSTPCATCGKQNCKTCVACPCGPSGKMWIRAEYLMWWTDGMDTPPLVSTGGTTRATAGVLGNGATSVLFGGQELFDDTRSGGRFRLGTWCDRCQWIGFETDFLFLDTEEDNFWDCDLGTQVVARPFFNANTNLPDSELVNFPGIVAGTIHVDANSSLWSIGPRARINLACESMGGCGNCADCRNGGSYRLDMLAGYRYINLEDNLAITEHLTTVNNNTPTYFTLRDQFDAKNQFHGGDLGLLWEGYRGPWSLELMGRAALGSTHQKVDITGSTQTTTNGATFNDPGGLLALQSNIGSYSRNKFSVIPEFSATLGFAVAPTTRVTVGYTFLYWNNVVRAGEQIDTRLNPDLFPPAQNTTGRPLPQFAFDDGTFWAQGLSLGFDHRW